MNVILASASPRRSELLKMIYEDFSVVPSNAEEIIPSECASSEVPLHLAKCKAEAVANEHKNSLVIGADTIVLLNNKIYGKPHNISEAKQMLNELSNNTHSVITGCCICFNGCCKTFSQKTDVTFYPLTDDEIDKYIKTEEPMDKAGAYGIQGYGSLLVEKINGDYFNVVGLPVARLKKEIDKFISDYSLQNL